MAEGRPRYQPSRLLSNSDPVLGRGMAVCKQLTLSKCYRAVLE